MNKISWFLLAALAILWGCGDDEKEKEQPGALPGNIINAIHITDDGLRYFATDKGIAGFDGTHWKVYDENQSIVKSIIFDVNSIQTNSGMELLLATGQGANIASLPISGHSNASILTVASTQAQYPGQATLASDSVFAVFADGNNIRWFGTKEGLSAFSGNSWPAINLRGHYHPGHFRNFRVTSFDYSNDTVYIGTRGGGVARMVVTAPDAISGASPYEEPWSQLPSYNIMAVFIDGAKQWYGTDRGIGINNGNEAMGNWDGLYESDGLVNNYVQAINKDQAGNLWFGTKGGVSKYNGTTFTNYTTTDGLTSNNVLCIAIDRDGSIWFGTDEGVTHLKGTIFTTYKARD
jgi:ligand-binding sensor domain-containing protein